MKRSNSLLKRATAIFLLLIFIQSSFLPNYAWALTTGPHQPEYISYEGSGSPDMVNLSTGDFTFSLPVLEVPGPEGSFPVPLSYHGGIGLDQDASWVGLGWTMNPGAITRTINEYPDDANGESQSVSIKDLNVIRGWTSSILGFGQIGWNNQTGHSGSVSLLGLLDYNYSDTGPNSLGIAGVNISNSGVHVDPVGVAMAALTVASMGAGGAFASGKALLTDLAWNAAGTAALSPVFGAKAPSVGTNGFWSYSQKVKQRLFHKNYWIWLDKTRTEQMYGVLNLGSSGTESYTNSLTFGGPNVNITLNGGASTPVQQYSTSSVTSSTSFQKGIASDMSYFIDPAKEYFDQLNPTGLAQDNFNVSGQGISGSIKPYRLEIGSLSVPREMAPGHSRFAVLPYLNSYKVPFQYDGSNSSNYFYHAGNTPGSAPTQPAFNPGINTSVGNADPVYNTSITFNLNDHIFANRVSSNVSSTYKIPQQNHVEWYTNYEIKNGTAISKGFMDFTGDNTIRNNFRSNFGFGVMYFYATDDNITDGITLSGYELASFSPNDVVSLEITHNDVNGAPNAVVTYQNIPVTSVSSTSITVDVSTIATQDRTETSPNYLGIQITLNKSTKPATSIGGFSITDGSGATHHYSLPVYDNELYTEIVDKDFPTKFTKINRKSPFANTWLLTSITGPDYYDYNANGFPDEGDWGYWVRLNYGRHSSTTSGMFHWRMPFSGTKMDSENKIKSFTEGQKETYYLNSIQTRTHTALFFKESRLDGKGSINATTQQNQGTQLRLKEIYLVKNEDYKYITGATGLNLGSCAGTTGKLWLTSDLAANNSALANYLNSNVLKKVELGFSYNLCKSTLNSSATGQGKLTLDRVAILGRNQQKIAPDFVFQYAQNPDYNKDYADAWGFYNGLNSRIPDTNDQTATAWSLTKVITPLGHEININYERDDYSTVWGGQLKLTNNFSDTSWGDGIVVPEWYNFSAGDEVKLEGMLSYTCANEYYQEPFNINATVFEAASGYVKVTVSEPTPPCGSQVSGVGYVGAISKDTQKKGGDLRVASIVTKESGGQEYKSRYIYTNSTIPGTMSSGSLSQEPDYIKPLATASFPTNLPDFPNTPVIYGKVAVLQGKLSTDDDYNVKTIYSFETPNSGHILHTRTVIGTEKEKTYTFPAPYSAVSAYQTKVTHQIDYYTSKIGRINSIEVRDNTGATKSTSTFYYSNQLPNYQGVYTEGSLLAERIKSSAANVYDRLGRTLKRSYPNVLYKVVNTKNGISDSSEDLAWDFVSGIVTEKVTTSSLGLKTKTVSKPAYLFYPELGPKANNADPTVNKNMLSMISAQYTYKVDNSNAVIGLLSASSSTWKNDWNNYRYLNGASYTQGTQGPNIWRKHRDYFYKGSYSARQSDGTLSFSSGNEFSFASGASNTGWQQVSEVDRYDHFSAPLEIKDIYGRSSATKLDLDGKQIIAQASNASYFELAFSSAEDGDNTKLFFGGEIERKNGTVIYKSQGGNVHSGNAAVQVTNGNKSFVYKPSSLTGNRNYRISTWCDSPNGAAYYILNGGSEQTIGTVSTQKVGSWYQINVEIPVTTFTSLEVGVKSTSGTVTFDDFRFQPVDAAMSTNVFNAFGDIEYVLDNNNLYTRYEYNDRGLIVRTYRESIKHGGVQLMTETKDNYRRFKTQQ